MAEVDATKWMRRYAISAPSEGDALRLLRSTLGNDAEQTWREACRQAGVRSALRMASDDVAKVAQGLVSTGGLVAVLARQIIIRVNTYAVLAMRLEREGNARQRRSLESSIAAHLSSRRRSSVSHGASCAT